MYTSKEEIQELVNNFCMKNNININKFEVSEISEATGGKSQRLYNRTRVNNHKCKYVIKYYSKLNIFVIWNYEYNKNMNYSLKTIKDKLSKGIIYADKGTEFHTRKQYLVYFNYGKNLSELLSYIINPV